MTPEDNENLLFINDGPNKVSKGLSRVFCSQALYESAHEDPSCNQSDRLYTIHPYRLRGTGGSIGADGTPMSLIAVALLMVSPISDVLTAKHLARKKPLCWSESAGIPILSTSNLASRYRKRRSSSPMPPSLTLDTAKGRNPCERLA